MVDLPVYRMQGCGPGGSLGAEWVHPLKGRYPVSDDIDKPLVVLGYGREVGESKYLSEGRYREILEGVFPKA
jgi:hypothetical protein